MSVVRNHCRHCDAPIWFSNNYQIWCHEGERNSLVCYPDNAVSTRAEPPTERPEVAKNHDGTYAQLTETDATIRTAAPYGVDLEFATDNIWAMADRPGYIGLRFDSGDAGVIYMTKTQAMTVVSELSTIVLRLELGL